jgi:hypothetical protein
MGAAWGELLQAFQSLRAVPYRQETVDNDPRLGLSIIREEIIGSASHSVWSGLGVNSEFITIAGDTWIRLSPQSDWQCPSNGASSIPGPPADLEFGGSWAVPGVPDRGEVAVAKGSDEVIGPVAIHTYEIAYRGYTGERRSVSVFIDAQTHLPRRVDMNAAGGSARITYYDFNARISIAPPASCR